MTRPALLLLVLGACSSPPEVSSVDPAEAQPGGRLRILGANFAEGATVQVGDISLTDVEVPGPVLIEAMLPDDLAPGTYELTVTVDGTVSTTHGSLTIPPPPIADIPCGGAYTANTQMSLARDLIVIDKFYRDGERQTERVPIPDVEKVEYELVRGDNGALCSVIFLRTKDGRRLMFDDDSELDLKERAYMMGRDMSKPVDVVRQDAPSLTAPDTP